MRVMIAAGGSGGHIFPALALARTLAERPYAAEVIFVGGNKALDRRIFEREGYRFFLLTANKLPYNKSLLRLVTFAVLLVWDFLRMVWALGVYRPAVIVGFGGYVSFPALAAGKLFGIRTVVHEQNVVAGRANRILFRWADRIGLSFAETRRTLGPAIGKAAVTGNPVRAGIADVTRDAGIAAYGLDARRFTVLVVGGSQGAHGLNEAVIAAFAGMAPADRSGMQVIHLTGIKDYERAGAAYRAAGVEHRVFSFLDRIEEAYAAADLVVTRSGASALFELALIGRPLILVPYPYALSHQAENARVFDERGGAVVIEERMLTPGLLRETISLLARDPVRRAKMVDAVRRLAVPDAAARLAAAVCVLTEKAH